MKILLLVVAVLAGTARADSPKSSQPGELAAFHFDRGSSTLPRDLDTDGFEAIVAWADANPDGLVVLDGHADDTGAATANLRLSFERAKTVRTELMLAGIDPDHIVVAAFGNGGPRATHQRRVVAWGTRAGVKAVVARTRAIGRSIVSTGLLRELELNQPTATVARR